MSAFWNLYFSFLFLFLFLPWLKTSQGASHFAGLYRRDGLTGGHVIQLGPGNTLAAKEALATWPGALQVGGGVNVDNAKDWLEAGASKVRWEMGSMFPFCPLSLSLTPLSPSLSLSLFLSLSLSLNLYPLLT